MISFVYGDNNYQARQILNKITDSFLIKNAIEKYDGEELEVGRLPDILRGASLFASQKLVIFYGSAQNKPLWSDLAEYLETLPSELQLVLLETQPDKRTRTFKLLQKLAVVHECKNLSPGQAIQWLELEAKKYSLELSPADTKLIIERAGLDQWQLGFALEKLSLQAPINQQIIKDSIEPSLESNVFELIDAALSGDKAKIQTQVMAMSSSQEPYQFFGLLSSQVFQLVTLAASQKSYTQVAKDLGVHPYPLQKVSGLAKRLSPTDSKKIVQIIATCDERLKRSGAPPWEIIELALLKLATLQA